MDNEHNDFQCNIDAEKLQHLLGTLQIIAELGIVFDGKHYGEHCPYCSSDTQHPLTWGAKEAQKALERVGYRKETGQDKASRTTIARYEYDTELSDGTTITIGEPCSLCKYHLPEDGYAMECSTCKHFYPDMFEADPDKVKELKDANPL